MSILEMLGQSSILALLGMATVFFFLVILVASISLTSRILATAGAGPSVEGIDRSAGAAKRTAEHTELSRVGNEGSEQGSDRGRFRDRRADGAPDERLVAAISAAVVAARKGKGGA